MYFRQIEDPLLSQYAYLIGCQKTGEAIVIDPERDIDRYLGLASAADLRITAVAETHIHADFLSGCHQFAAQEGVRVYLSDEGDQEWKYAWDDAGHFELRFLRHGDRFLVGRIELEARHTPGHTPEHLSFLVTDGGSGARDPMGVVTGDFVFVGDLGRPDLLESAAGQRGVMRPSAKRLYASVQGFLTLPDYLQVWPGHGAGSFCGKALGAVPDSTVGYERRNNEAILAVEAGEEAFVEAILAGQPDPPLYFARMKAQNKTGPGLLRRLPDPHRLSARELATQLERPEVRIVDTRASRRHYMESHLPGSLYAPLNTNFPATVGSYLPENASIYLIVGDDNLDEAIRSLVRIGLDHLEGFVSPSDLAAFLHTRKGTQIEQIDFKRVAELASEPDYGILDVRSSAEFQAGHLPEAVHIAYTRLASELPTLERGKTWMVHCGTGSRAAGAAAFLAGQGFQVFHVDDQLSNASAIRKP